MAGQTSINKKLSIAELLGTQPKGCFACGVENVHGLHLHFEQTKEGSKALFTPSMHHEGWPGIIHGGILLTAMDEAMAYALYFRQIAAFTGRLESRFRLPASPGQRLEVRGRVTDERKRVIEAEAAILAPTGSIVAEARARFVPVQP